MNAQSRVTADPAEQMSAEDRQSALAYLRKQASRHASLGRVARQAQLPTLVEAHRHRLSALMMARNDLKQMWGMA